MTDASTPRTLHYKRSHFVTHLPLDYVYSPSHFWLAPQPDASWRIGLTKFASRMLGEIVDFNLDKEPGSPVSTGEIVGWIEGFKAVSDLYCVLNGVFGTSNPALKAKMAVVNKDPYGLGWIYEGRGEPDPKCMDVDAYKSLLDQTIDRILEKQKTET